MKKVSGKRIVASILTLAMLVSAVPSVFAADGTDDSELINELLSYSEDYPEGAFAFHESQLTAGEDEGEIYIDVARYGSFDGDASVTFKAIDVSAKYGKDYTLSVDEGWFLTRELEQDMDAVPLVDIYADTSAEVTIGEDKAEAGEDDAAEQLIEMAIDAESGELSVKDSSKQAEEKEATGLRAARNAYVGNESDRKSWQEITGTENAEVAEAESDMDNVPEYIGEFADGLPGTEYELHFKDGEYLKRIKINLIDDDISETDEQVMFIVYNPENADIAKPQTAYLNILDTDENEPVVFYIDNESVITSPAEGYAEVTVKRDSGVEKFASVTVGTGAIDAEPDVDYKSGSIEVVFPQGVTERTVKIPVYNAMRTDSVNFAVALDKETAFVDEERYATLVTILPDYSEESMQLYSEVLEDMGQEGKSVEVYLPENEDGGNIRLASNSDTYNNGFVNAVVISPKNVTTNYGSYVTVLRNLDLRNAAKIEISYKLDGWYSETYSYKDGCSTKTGTRNKTGNQAEFKVGGKTVSVSGSQGSTGTVALTGFPKQKGQTLEVHDRKTESHNVDNHWTACYINKVVITYDDLTVTIDNTTYDTNRYVEKIYAAGNTATDQGMGYSNGNTMKLGDGYVSGGSTSVKVNRFTSGINLMVKDTDGQKTTQGVVPKIGTNVYLAGWQFYDSKHNKYLSDIIKPDDMTMDTIFNYELKAAGGNQTDRTSFQVRPVLKPYPSMIRFNNSNAGSLAYTNNISNGKEIGVRMLDTLNLEVIPVNNSGRAVDSFIIKGDLDNEAHNTSGSKRSNRAGMLESYAYGTTSETNKSRTSYLDSGKNGTYKVTCDVNSADSNKIVLKPNCEAINIDMTYTTPKIDVRYNPSKSAPTEYKNQGTVVYVNQDTKTSVNGNYETPMVIQPVDYSHIFNINALYEDTKDGQKEISDYKTVWQDFTGDLDGNGELSMAEVEALARYNLDRAPATGDTYNYQPKVTNSEIYYYFVKREKVQSAGGIYGVVELKDYPIFGGEGATYTPINGATVTVDGKDQLTRTDSSFGGDKGTGGDGYFYFTDPTFIAGESHRVIVQYGPLSTSAVHYVNVAQKYILDAYDTISVISASRIKGSDAMKATQPVLNDDANYTLVFGTVSSISAKVATKATLKFYRRDGTYIDKKEYNSTGTNTGVFNCQFNPKTLGLPPGSYITVQFTDNDGVEYFEHDTGISIMQSLGLLSLMSSFSGGANEAFKIIGQIGALFGFGWDGNLDDGAGDINEDDPDAGNYSLETTEESKVLTLNLGFSTDGKIGDDKKDKDKEDGDKDKEGGDKDKEKPSKSEVKEAAKSGSDSEQKDAADKADKKKKENESKLTTSYKLKFTFGLTLTLSAATDPAHKGEWKFDEFMIVINAGASLKFSTTYTTPIGVPITFSLTVGADASAIIVVESRLGTSYYMASLADGTGSVNLIKQGQSLDDYMYVYGKFTVAPFIEIAVKVGWTGFSAQISGRATLKFVYDMKEESFTGSVTFKCKLTIEVILFKKSWTLAEKTIDLFSAGPELYESLDEFEVSDRENLQYRTEWNGGGGIQLLSVAGLNERDVKGGINPNADTKIMPLGDGKYIAVFVDDVVGYNDVTNRDEYNSLGVFYTIYDGTEWSEPQIIEDDGTLDDSPDILDVGDGRLFVAWSSANKEFNSDLGVLEMLNARNIHGRFFSKATQEFGDIIEVTKNTDEDWAGDTNPHIAYDGDSKRMIIYYTKEEYKASSADGKNGVENGESEEDNAGVYGDAVYPYSVVAYRLYDTETNQFIGYSDEEIAAVKADRQSNTNEVQTEEQLEAYWQQYKADYYEQRFLDLAPVTVSGQGNLVESNDTDTNDPLVIETDAIGYNHLALFSYILDYDGDKSTTFDRDIYMQIYNFEEDSISYPVKLTSTGSETNAEDEKAAAAKDGATQKDTASKIRFERIGGAHGITYLAYLCDGEVRMINISDNISDNTVLKETEISGTKYYVLDKEAENYISEETLISSDAGGDYTGETKITDFNLRSNDKCFYVMFTESVTRPKDGIEDGTEEATKPENRVAESHIYMKRGEFLLEVDKNDPKKGTISTQFTNPVQVTKGEGQNYDNIAFAVEGDGFVALATRCPSAIIKVEGEDTVAADTSNSTLCAINFEPDANVELRKGYIDNIVSNSDVFASFEVYNGGIETIDGLTVEITDDNGAVITPAYENIDTDTDINLAGYNTDTDTISLIGGEYQVISMALPVSAEENSAGFTAVVKDSNGNKLDTLKMSDSVEQKLDTATFSAKLPERGVLSFKAMLVNNQSVASGKQTFQLVADGDNVLYEQEIESLVPDETITIEDAVDIDYSELFKEVTNEDGSVTADLKLTATAGGETRDETVSLYATKEQMARLNAVKSVSFGAGNSVSVKRGSVLDLAPKMVAGDYVGGRIDDNNESEIDAQGVELMYVSSDEDIAQVYQNGFISGESKGQAKITAMLIPSDVSFDGTNYESRYATLPEKAIKTYTVDVTVSEAQQSTPTPTATPRHTGGSSTGGTGLSKATPKPTASPVETTAPDATPKPSDSGASISGDWWFKDVPETAWYYSPIKDAYYGDRMSGMSEDYFEPETDITRGMFAYAIYRREGLPETDSVNKFDDVKADTYYETAIAWATENEIVAGYDDTHYGPDDQITREQMAAILWRYAKFKEYDVSIGEETNILDFTDALDISEYAIPAIQWAVGDDVITGFEDGAMRPKSNATRAQMAVILNKIADMF